MVWKIRVMIFNRLPKKKNVSLFFPSTVATTVVEKKGETWRNHRDDISSGIGEACHSQSPTVVQLMANGKRRIDGRFVSVAGSTKIP